MNTPVTLAQMTPAEDSKGVRVEVEVLHLDDIPKAMDNMGWTVSAQLMRRWFATKPSWAMPEEWRSHPPKSYAELPAIQVEDHIVTMAWAMQPTFPQVHAALTQLRRTWKSERGIALLVKRLNDKKWAPGQTLHLGAPSMSAKQLDDECQVNTLAFGDASDTVNDFFGAIFKASLKVAVVGKAYRNSSTGKDLFDVENVGFYIRDTYDFNAGWLDDAFMGLGVWSKQRALNKAEMVRFKALSALDGNPAALLIRNISFPGFVPLRNIDFRRWQQKHGSGGDFFVFSDVLWEPYVGPALALS